MNEKLKMASKSITVKDVAPNDFIAHYAKFLKKTGRVKVPKWVDIVKTAHFKELPPANPDWLYVRIASLARKVYITGNEGVGSFRRIYGGKERFGNSPNHTSIACGAVIRYALKQLAQLKVVEVDKTKGGRKITSTGRRDLDRIANN
ncbi:40S ribosomal protein S19 [Cavenderia fasciculata]|uniref:40S ribosomal protein S19 n=1 Tax=Cavenderia fasciculata TaxID=261658 RepID=F4PXY6_CACFS|nr:40S ribosomal protein S19 [Cavenderia fasciculata]EGG19646.1 40S ribosomal protein S19 [Cavenderia fasciculata]|eukprot:XP_004357940.1 40S ribosomal protein S19 [Cavenderia fasciculata]